MTKKYLVLPLALLALVASFAVDGCGSDDKAESSLTKAEFQHKANLICSAASNEQFEKASRYLRKNPKAGEADLVEPAGIPPLEKEFQELKNLSVSGEFEEQVDAFLEEFEKGLEAIKSDPTLALSTQGNPFDKANSLAEKYKFGDCSDTP